MLKPFSFLTSSSHIRAATLVEVPVQIDYEFLSSWFLENKEHDDEFVPLSETIILHCIYCLDKNELK